MTLLKPFAFVLMPFESRFTDIYKYGIQQTAKDVGVVAERVDEQIYTETILERIYRQIDAADFIIADMTGRNPNVFYEVGYAHAKGKLCTLLTQEASDIPFDLRHHRHIIYGGSIEKLKANLGQDLKWLIAEVDRRRSSNLDIQISTSDGLLEKTEWYAMGKFTITIDIHNRSNNRSPEIEAMYLHTGGKWEFKQNGEVCPSTTTDGDKNIKRHFLRSPVTRLSPGAWAQVKIEGERQFGSKFRGDELKDKYNAKGFVRLEIATSEGVVKSEENVDVDFDEFPF